MSIIMTNFAIVNNILRPYLFRKDLFLCLFLFVVSFAVLSSISRDVLFTQDELANNFGAISILKKGNIVYSNKINQEYKTNLIGPSFVTYIASDKQIYNNFSGTALIYALLIFIFTKLRISFVILGSLSVVLAYYISKLFFGNKLSGIYYAVYILTLPLFLIYSSSFYNTLLVIFITLLLLITLLIKVRYSVRISFLLLFLTVLLIIRNDLLFSLTPVYYFAGYYYLLKYLKSIPKTFLGILIFTFVTILPVFIVNVLISQKIIDPHTSSYSYIFPGSENNIFKNYHASFFEKILAYFLNTPVGFVGFSFKKYISALENSANYLFGAHFAVPLLILTFIFLPISFLDKKLKNKSIIFLLFISFVLSLIVYGSNNSTYGFGIENIRSAILRYMTPIIVSISVLLGYIPIRLNNNKILNIVVFFLFCNLCILVSANMYFNSDVYGIKLINIYKDNQLDYQKKLRNKINIDDSALFIADPYTEKYLFSEYQKDISNLNVITLSKFDIYKNTNYEFKIRRNLMDLISRFLLENKKVYLVLHSEYQENYMLTFLPDKFRIEELFRYGDYKLYNLGIF